MQSINTKHHDRNLSNDRHVHRSIVASYQTMATQTMIEPYNEEQQAHQLIDQVNQGFVLGYN
ncbi:hypothetical protein [Thalassotalea marina]|uniref:Uncharacterized protein n=1 Tax=Thalassotalea marina TaxID=1673741 RepID=A0A919BLQ8_9GAMM|nr:hypothetical protein [Thalassotalea marina]GHF95756.1 hypothetical protein GCM10017161_25090 [Thalassotalea marina]